MVFTHRWLFSSKVSSQIAWYNLHIFGLYIGYVQWFLSFVAILSGVSFIFSNTAPFFSSSTSFWHQFFHFLLTYSFTHRFFLFWFTLCTSITPSLFHSRLKLKPTSFTNPAPSPVVSHLPPGLPPLYGIGIVGFNVPQTFAWTVSSEVLGYGFYFFLIFVSGPCARLIWPSHQFLSSR